MNKQEQLAKAIKLAAIVHQEQFDKGGKPYILHPLHLMQQLLFDMELATIAVLHDVVEDSNDYITVQVLKEQWFSDRVCSAVELLTHKQGENYHDYIEGICTNIDAIRVKRKDLEHNSDITRLKGVRPKDLERLEKYHLAFLRLGRARDNFSQT